MKVVCHSYTSDHALKYCAAMLLAEHMFEASGQLQDSLERIAKTGKDARRAVVILVAWAGVNLDKVVGCLLYDPVRSRAQFYVPPTHRRRGIARQLLKRLRGMENYGNRVIEAAKGFPGSMEFFDKHFVYVPDDTFSEEEIQTVAKSIRVDENDTRELCRWSAIHEIQIQRKRAFRQKYMAAKKARLL